MFQMSKQLFDQCWPVIAAQIAAEKSAADGGEARNDTVRAPSPGTAAEAGYVLGVAIGYALQVDYAAGAPVSISVPGWRADACGDMNWPHVVSPRMPQTLASRPA
jgi:hypothetical protein